MPKIPTRMSPIVVFPEGNRNPDLELVVVPPQNRAESHRVTLEFKSGNYYDLQIWKLAIDPKDAVKFGKALVKAGEWADCKNDRAIEKARQRKK